MAIRLYILLFFFKTINLLIAKLFIFINEIFTNNKDQNF